MIGSRWLGGRSDCGVTSSLLAAEDGRCSQERGAMRSVDGSGVLCDNGYSRGMGGSAKAVADTNLVLSFLLSSGGQNGLFRSIGSEPEADSRCTKSEKRKKACSYFHM